MKKNYFLMIGMTVLMLTFGVVNTVKAQLYINEFMASNDAAVPGPQGDYPDWIEIYNAGTEDIMLGGYYIYDTLDVNEAFQIPDTYPDSVTVPAGGYILFYANKGDESSVLNLNFKLSGGGEQIGFWNPDQEEIDGLTYGSQTADISYGRYPDGTDNWAFMTNYTPGEENTEPTPPLPLLYINEFMASNDFAVPGPQGDYPDWIEIYNASNEDIMLGGYYLADDLTDPDAMYQIPDTYPDSVTVPAGGFILFYANKNEESSVLNLPFSLKSSGEQVGLWTPGQVVLDSITYPSQSTDTSYGRYPNGEDNWFFMSDFTPGEPNTNPNPGPGEITLYINEFMASNDFAVPGPQDDYPDWIEIYNAGDEDVMLGGYYLADDLADPGAMYQIPNTYPDSVTVPAGGFILFYANKSEESSVLNLPFSLKGSGEQVGLWDPNQNVLDSLSYDQQITDTSYGRYPDGSESWYMMPTFTPGAPNVYTDAIEENTMNATLSQNYPNPFSNTTNIEFSLDEPGYVTITVYTISGSVVTVLADESFNNGKHLIHWNASALPAGYYFYSIKTSAGTIVKKATVLK